MTMTLETKHSDPLAISVNKSLVEFRNIFRTGMSIRDVADGTTTPTTAGQTTPLTAAALEQPHKSNLVVRPAALVSPTTSSTNLHEQMAAVSPPRPLKKRKIVVDDVVVATPMIQHASSAAEEDDACVLRRKALAAKLRANGVARRMVLKPSAFAMSMVLKHTRPSHNNTIPGQHVPSFSDPTPTAMEIHQNHSQQLYHYVRTGTDFEGFKRCVRQIQNQYYTVGSNSDTSCGDNEQPTEREQLPFRCSNRFGESLLHLACRRGRTEMVRFLVEELETPGADYCSPRTVLTVRDDCGKTPLHDACWTPSPNPELVALILKHCPEQVLARDVRGNTPFDYVRASDNGLWLRFLWSKRALLTNAAERVGLVTPPRD